jgi:hypothetical protein
MKYFGEPGMTIIDYKKLKKVFQFDEKGEFETNDPKLITWMKKNKNFIRCEETPSFKCKKCDFTTPNKGELLQHYKKEHPKED